MPQQVREGLTLTIVAAAVFLTGLGTTHLWDDDEAFFAQTAREMFERGDLVVPWFNQALFAHKPPFMYWMMIAAYKVLGITEFAARLPSVLFGMATVLLVWRLGRILYSPGVGFWAGIILATSLNFVVISRAATCDAELIFFCALAMYLFVCGFANNPVTAEQSDVWGESSGQLSWKSWALVYSAMGMAMLVKGPIGVLLPTSVLGLYLICQRAQAGHRKNDAPAKVTLHGALWNSLRFFASTFAPTNVLRTIWTMRPLTAVAAVILVTGPWFAAVGFETHGEFLRGFFGVHHFHRFTNPMDNHSGPVFYYPAAICIGFFPWIIFILPSCLELRRQVHELRGWQPADILVLSWFITWVGFFSLATTKFPHYVVPAYPALALFTARFVERWTREPEIYVRLARSAAWLTVGAVGLGILVTLPIIARIYLPGERLLGLAGVPLVAGAVVCGFLAERRQIVQALGSLTVTAGVFFIITFGPAAAEVDRHQNTASFAAAIRQHSPTGGARIAAFRCFRPGLVYYSNERVEQPADPAAVTAFLNEHLSSAFLLATESDYERMAPELPASIAVLQRSPRFLKAGETLVLLGRTQATTSKSADPMK